MNTEHQLTWPKCTESMKLKQNGTRAMTTEWLKMLFVLDYNFKIFI